MGRCILDSMFKKYSLKKIRNLTYHLYRWYVRHGKNIPEGERAAIERLFKNVDGALLSKDKVLANEEYGHLETAMERKRQNPFWKYPLEFIGALAFALLVATVIRQMVFEPYEIPSGSMRPTFEEQDHLIVSKSAFGINIPFTTGHFLFDPSLLPLASVIVFSAEGIDLPDTDTKYFWLFPAKKRYIKRCMGRPGDALYFYGGLLYGIDKDGNDLIRLREAPFNTTLDHVPFLQFSGMVAHSQPSINGMEFTYSHFHQPIGKMVYSSHAEVQGLVYNGSEWVKDQPAALKSPHREIKTFSDYFGISNYAMCRLLNKDEMGKLYPEFKRGEGSSLFLEILHTPRLAPLPAKGKSAMNPLGRLAYESSILPLTSKEIERLQHTLYTSRFTVVNGRAHRFDAHSYAQYDVPFPHVPDGTYEFQDGKAYQIGFLGWRTELSKEHPIYNFTLRSLQNLFNYGLEFTTALNPLLNDTIFPARYAYYREGDFYVMGRKLLDQSDPQLSRFVESETKKGAQPSYVPFIDRGPPLKDGKIDAGFIRTFGYNLGPKEYLALGDNYAMSADSRIFGSVPQGNLEGTPSFLLWPIQERFGVPKDISYQGISWPSVIVWTVFISACTTFIWWERRKKALPIFKQGLQ